MTNSVRGAAAGQAAGVRSLLRKLVISVMVAALFVWLLRAGALPVWPPQEALARVDWSLVVWATLLLAVMQLVRGVRWHFLILPVAPIAAVSTLRVALIGFAATLLLPLRSGEVVRPLLIRREGVDGWAATGTVGAERIIDGSVVSAFLLLSLTLSPPLITEPIQMDAVRLDPRWVSAAARGVGALFAVAFCALILFFWFRTLPRRLLDATLGRLRPALAEKIADRVELLASGLSFLTRPAVALPFLLFTALYWVMNVAALWLVGRAVGFTTLTALRSCAVLGVLAIGVMPPGAPGMFGSFQFAMYAALALFFPIATLKFEGAALVFVSYVLQVGVQVLAGAAALVSLLRARTSAEPALADKLANSSAGGNRVEPS